MGFSLIQDLVHPHFSKIIRDECGKVNAAITEVGLEQDWDGFLITAGKKRSRISMEMLRDCVARDDYAALDEAFRAAVKEVIAN